MLVVQALLTCSTERYDGRHVHKKHGISAQYAVDCCQGSIIIIIIIIGTSLLSVFFWESTVQNHKGLFIILFSAWHILQIEYKYFNDRHLMLFWYFERLSVSYYNSLNQMCFILYYCLQTDIIYALKFYNSKPLKSFLRGGRYH